MPVGSPAIMGRDRGRGVTETDQWKGEHLQEIGGGCPTPLKIGRRATMETDGRAGKTSGEQGGSGVRMAMVDGWG